MSSLKATGSQKFQIMLFLSPMKCNGEKRQQILLNQWRLSLSLFLLFLETECEHPGVGAAAAPGPWDLLAVAPSVHLSVCPQNSSCTLRA